jgi:choline dehydrogenase-like flavoprotein
VTARARGEVILSAGAVGSPQILQLSGVGRADWLGEFGIRSCSTSRASAATAGPSAAARHLQGAGRPGPSTRTYHSLARRR